MTVGHEGAKPTQRTPEDAERVAANLPGEGGTEIPVPGRVDVMAAFRKVAKAPEPDDDDDQSA